MAANEKSTLARGVSMMASIQKLNPYITLRSDGTLSLAAPAALTSTVPSEDLAALQQSVSSVNSRIASGEVVATSGGTLLPARSNPLILSDGSTYYASYWWGQSWCFSHADLYANFVLATEATITGIVSYISGIAGLSLLYLEWELLVVDYWGGNNGACINLINSQVVTFTPNW